MRPWAEAAKVRRGGGEAGTVIGRNPIPRQRPRGGGNVLGKGVSN